MQQTVPQHQPGIVGVFQRLRAIDGVVSGGERILAENCQPGAGPSNRHAVRGSLIDHASQWRVLPVAHIVPLDRRRRRNPGGVAHFVDDPLVENRRTSWNTSVSTECTEPSCWMYGL